MNNSDEQPKKYPFENLVFEGGGVLGVAYQGVYEALDEFGITHKEIKRICGTSAGCISALMIALRYTPAECKEELINADFKSFQDGGFFGIFRLFTSFGWYKGAKMQQFFEYLIKKKTGKPDLTFAEMKAAGYPEFRLVSTNVTQHKPVVFSVEHTPDLSVSKAMRLSTSVPYVFAAETLNNDVYSDGGVLRNFDIDEFDNISAQDRTIGFYLMNSQAKVTPISGFLSYCIRLMALIKNQQYYDLISESHDVKRSVFIDVLNIGSMDFGIDKEHRLALMESGKAATVKYLQEWKA